jgi:hypothetical protein
MSEWTGLIPANPEINSKALHDHEVANMDLSVRDRQAARRVFIPPDEPDEQVEVPKVQRRHFVDPNAIGGRPLRKD